MSGQLRLSNIVLSGTTTVNILAGRKQEFLGRPAVVSVYQRQDDVSGSVIESTLTLGNVIVAEDIICNRNVAAATEHFGSGPNTNEDLVAQGVGAAGDRIQIQLRETTGGAADDGVMRTLVTIADL